MHFPSPAARDKGPRFRCWSGEHLGGSDSEVGPQIVQHCQRGIGYQQVRGIGGKPCHGGVVVRKLLYNVIQNVSTHLMKTILVVIFATFQFFGKTVMFSRLTLIFLDKEIYLPMTFDSSVVS